MISVPAILIIGGVVTGAGLGAQPVSVSSPVSPASSPTVSTVSNSDFEQMTREMRKTAGKYRGHVSIYVKNLQNGREWAYNADRMMPSASLIKVPVMAGVYEKISKGELSLDQPLTLTKKLRRAGSGHLKWRKNGEQFTVRELLGEMIGVSDNIAQEMLVQAVGIKYLQSRFPTFDLSLTNITREGLSVASWTPVENYTTAREMGRLLENIYRGQKFGSEASAEMIELLKSCKYKERLPRHIPEGWSIAHKTGLLRRACHDIGIVSSPAGDYIICVLTHNGPSYKQAKQFISKIGAISFRCFDSPMASVVSAPSGGRAPSALKSGS